MAKTALDKLFAKIEKANVAGYTAVLYDGERYYSDSPLKVFEVDEHDAEIIITLKAKSISKFVDQIEKYLPSEEIE